MSLDDTGHYGSDNKGVIRNDCEWKLCKNVISGIKYLTYTWAPTQPGVSGSYRRLPLVYLVGYASYAATVRHVVHLEVQPTSFFFTIFILFFALLLYILVHITFSHIPISSS